MSGVVADRDEGDTGEEDQRRCASLRGRTPSGLGVWPAGRASLEQEGGLNGQASGKQKRPGGGPTERQCVPGGDHEGAGDADERRGDDR
jgi:hypothetical protein